MNGIKKTILGVMIAGLLLTFASEDAKAKRYLVKPNSQQAYETLSAHAKGFQTFGQMNNSGLQFLASGDTKIEKALDKVEMLVIDTDKEEHINMLKLTGSAYVEEEVFFPAPQPIGTFAGDVESTNNAPTSTPWGITAVKAQQAWAQGAKGQGVDVLVVDTGIDKDHIAIKSRFKKGKNFLERVDTPAYEFFDINGHGTHVAGTIAADGANGGLVGVAPEANILAGRVCGDLGCSSIAIVEAVDWGIQEGVDVINLSLGGPMPSQAAEMAYQRAEAANIVVVAAAGNSAQSEAEGCKTSPPVSFPGGYSSTIAVGAVDSQLSRACFSQFGPTLNIVAPGVDVLSSVPVGSGRMGELALIQGNKTTALEANPFAGSGVGSINSAEMVYAEMGRPEDFQKILDLSGKIALIKRGEITFSDKVKNAIAKNAAAVIVFNNAPGSLNGTLGQFVSPVPVLSISQVDGESLLSSIPNGVVINTAVIATDYSKMNGTSMASPHVAGVAALVKSTNVNITPADVKTALFSTATALGPNPENQFGVGMVNASAAVEQVTCGEVGCSELLKLVSGL